MKNFSLSKGFSILIIILVIVAVGLFGFVGYRAYEMVRENANTSEADKTQPSVADDVPAMESVERVETASDLDELSSMLDEINLDDDSDVTVLESELSSF